MLELNDTINQMDLAGIYRPLHPNTTDYAFFLADHRTFYKIEIKQVSTDTSYILSDNHGLHLDINNRKYTNSWELNNSLLNVAKVILNFCSSCFFLYGIAGMFHHASSYVWLCK